MFSVVVPVYNHKAFVEEAVESAVGDSLVHEVLLVDDLSSDGSAELIEQFPRRYGRKVRILKEARKSNRGAHERLNQLCEAAAGPWIAILNSDDVFMQGRCKIARDLAASRNVNFVTGTLQLIDASGAVIRGKSGNLDPDYPLPNELASADLNAELTLCRVLCSENVVMTTSNMMFTKSLFEMIGGFSDLRYCHDWDFALRACIQGRAGFSHIPITCYRIHAANTIQEPTPHVDGEAIRLFSRLLANFPWIEEDRLSVASLAGNRHLATFVGDAGIGQDKRVVRPPRTGRLPKNTDARPRCLIFADHDDESIEGMKRLSSTCDLHVVHVGGPEQSRDDVFELLERARDDFNPDIVYVRAGFEWCLRNAFQIRSVFANAAVVDEHPFHDAEKWRAYHRSKATNAFDRFIVENGVVAHIMATRCGIPRSRVDIIHPPIEPKSRADPSRDRPAGLTFVSPLTVDAHTLNVLDLARRCRDKEWPDVFLFAGPGDLTDACMRYATAARLDNIRWMPNEAVNAAMLRSADAAIVLSAPLSGSTGLLALANAKPFFSVATGEARSLLKEFGAGLLVNERANGDLVWRHFVAFRTSMQSLSTAATEGCGVLLCQRFSESYRQKAYGEAFARAIAQIRGRNAA